MRQIFLFVTVTVLLMCGCRKDNTPDNFSCGLAGSMTTPVAISGSAATSFSASRFIITMSGQYSSRITISWYNIDSSAAERGITTRTYTIPSDTTTTPTLEASYAPQNPSFGGVSYSTGAGTGGTVTITNNTGPGGVISGTYSFTALNPYYPFDTVYLNNGTFTNVSVVTH